MTAVTSSFARRPNVWVPSFELRRLAFRKVGCDAASRVWNAWYHLAVVASDVLLDSEHSEQSSSVERGRLHSLRTILTMLEQNSTSHLVCTQAGARACPFFARRVWIDSGSCAESSFKCFCVSSLRSESVFEETCLRGRQGFRPHGRVLDVFLDRFGFLKSVLDGLAVDRLGFP